MRERARDLGIVLDEHLVRDAERARTELDTLSQVISANLTGRARGGAGDRRSLQLARRCRWQGRHRLGAPVRCARGEEPADPALRAGSRQLDNREAGRADQELRESRRSASRPSSTRRRSTRWRRSSTSCGAPAIQTQARIAFLEGPPDTGAPARDTACSRRHRGREDGRRTWSGSRASSRARCSASRTRAASGSSPSTSAGSPRSRRCGPGTAATRSVDQLIAQSAAVRMRSSRSCGPRRSRPPRRSVPQAGRRRGLEAERARWRRPTASGSWPRR